MSPDALPALFALINGWGHLALAVPLVTAVGFVYSATRHEALGPILRHGTRLTLVLLGVLAIGVVLLSWLSSTL